VDECKPLAGGGGAAAGSGAHRRERGRGRGLPDIARHVIDTQFEFIFLDMTFKDEPLRDSVLVLS